MQGLSETIAALAPLVWLKLNDASGNAADSGSRATAATPTNVNQYRNIVGPDADSYVTFDGLASRYFSIAHGTNLRLNPATGTTFCCAFRPTNISGNRPALFGKFASAAGNRGYGVFVDATDTARLLASAYQAGATAVYSNERGPVISNNTWHFIVVKFTTSGTWVIFQDSLTENGDTITAPTGTLNQAETQPLIVGALPAFAGIETVGALAHFGMWNRALSDPECVTLMTAAKTQGWAP